MRTAAQKAVKKDKKRAAVVATAALFMSKSKLSAKHKPQLNRPQLNSRQLLTQPVKKLNALLV